ncbi:hypothetical protein C2845_PM04G20200 [Panicum miliaceum]|uniref:Uncharacterized protein n=1 Tax=Panicum miliaceum TaxID=4540 RepID=A0A3L6QL03_PANMI|nr:hypothetical protein C2845_PM04G20200 [Panicum miliaceum]
MRITRRLLLAAAALLLLVAGPAAAQDAAVEGVAPAAEELAANARAKEAAVLSAELVQLRAKISALGQVYLGNVSVETLQLRAKGFSSSPTSPLQVRAQQCCSNQFLVFWKLQRTSDDQKRRIQKIEHALKVAEEELMKVQLETTTKAKQLREVHGAWLPPWLATHAARSMEVVSNHWNEHGKPAFDSLLQKASEKSAQAKKWAEPHLETAKTKWMPVAKEKWATLKKNAEPYVQMVSEKSVEVYQTSSDFMRPHLVNAHQVADPYFQEAKKLSKPYIDQIATATKPHVEKIRTTLKPYTKRAHHVYGQFLETATTYHQQAQATVSDYLHQHEFTKQFVTDELVWYLAAALLVMPIFVLYTLLVDTFCTKKQKKTPRSSNANHGHRRHKRRHADK